MIKKFVHKGLEKFFLAGIKSGIQTKHSQKLADILDRLDASCNIKDMNYPGSNLHKLKGKFIDFWSVKISGNWRVIFRFKDNNVFDVNYIDYH